MNENRDLETAKADQLKQVRAAVFEQSQPFPLPVKIIAFLDQFWESGNRMPVYTL